MSNQIPGPHDEAVMGQVIRAFKPSLKTRLKALVSPSTAIKSEVRRMKDEYAGGSL